MSAELIAYIESLHTALARDYDFAHDKLSGVDQRDKAECEALIRHVDDVAVAMVQRRKEVLARVYERLHLTGQPEPVPNIEDRYTTTPIEHVANQMFDVLYANGATH